MAGRAGWQQGHIQPAALLDSLSEGSLIMLDTYLHSYIADLAWTLEEIDRALFKDVVGVLSAAREADRQIFVIGNGGSAATSSHLACDLGKGTADLSDPNFRRFRVISLSDNNAL